MKADYLIELICRPGKIGSEDLIKLDKLVMDYPYFQAARILQLKAMHQSSMSRFRSDLKENTIHLSNHKQFYKYLNNLIDFDYLVPKREDAQSSLPNIVADRIVEINGYFPVRSHGVPANNRQDPEKEKDTDTSIIDVDFLHIDDARAPYLSNEEQDPEVREIIDLSHIDGFISDYTEEYPPRKETTREDLYREYPFETENHPETQQEIDHKEPLIPIELFDEYEDVVNKPHYSPPGNILFEAGLIKYYAAYELDNSGQQTAQSERDSKKNELINRFIKEEPSMPRTIGSYTDNRDLSTESVSEKEDLFSETLAKIYTRQKLYDKAIATYIKLSLKYPEKSVYFANRIEKIKDKLNNE